MRTTKFKPSELGPIPVEWEVKKLGNLWTRFKTGPFGSSLHASDYVQNGVPLINPMHLLNGKIIPSEGTCVDEGTAHRLSEYRLAINDVIIARRGEIGRVALVTSHEDGWLCGTGCFFVHFKDSLHTPYLAWYLRTPQCAGQLVGEAVGTTLINLNQSILERTWIPLPPLREQLRIAEVLDDADAWIESLDKLIEKKKLVKQGTMQALLSGKTRLPGFSGEWEERPISDSLKPVPCPSALIKRNVLHYAKPGAFPAFSASGQDVWLPEATFHGDGIVVSAIGSRCGKAFLAKGDWGVVANTHVLLPKNGACMPYWFYILDDENWWLKAGTGQPYVMIRASLARTMKVPSLAEQRAIASVLSDMDAELAALSREKAKAEQIKQGMMQELLTGKTRLKGE